MKAPEFGMLSVPSNVGANHRGFKLPYASEKVILSNPMSPCATPNIILSEAKDLLCLKENT